MAERWTVWPTTSELCCSYCAS